MRLGVCWYPEQWPRERWATDVAMMADAGLELVRIGEFAWSTYEPARGEQRWGWLDDVIELIHAHDLRVVLGTPTATPPVWLARERPEILAVDASGRRRAYGSRRHTCPTSASYREEARRIVGDLVARYGSHPGIEAWQVDNEPGNHDSARCWCDECQRAFEAWLEARYGNVDELNERWGTAFWSGHYRSFEEVRLPVPTVTAQHPSLLLAHRRFASDQVLSGLAEQAELVRAHAPGRDVFTNLYTGDTFVDGHAIGRLYGMSAGDSYPHGTAGPSGVAYELDLLRASATPAGGTPERARVWIAEQQPGPVNWTPTNPEVPPGQVRTWIEQAAAHGVETLLMFRWRAARAGQERYHRGLLRHDATPDRGLAEVVEAAAALPAAPRHASRVAVVHDHVDGWIIDAEQHVPGVTHRSLVAAAYEAATEVHGAVDLIPVDADWSAYDLVLAPALHVTSAERLDIIRAAVANGTLVVLGPRSLVADADAVIADVAWPAGLAEALGARVGEWGASHAWPQAGPVLTAGEAPAGPWAETLELEPGDRAAEVLLRYDNTHRSGAPATVRRGRLAYHGASSRGSWVRALEELR